MTQNNVLVAQSGGPTTVINSSLAGVIASALKEKKIDKVYGARNGILGVLRDNIISLDELFGKNNGLLEQLKTTPSMFLGSCRHKLANIDQSTEEYKKIFEIFEQYNIRYFFYIGGNDSMDTVAKLSQYAKQIDYDIQIIGIPKTIDNDLVGIDHTPGFGSAAKYIASSFLEISHDTYIYDTESVVIVEVMGRNAGWLTASAVLARNEYSAAPHLIYLPEVAFSQKAFLDDVRRMIKENKQVVIAVSEGIKDGSGEYVSAGSAKLDSFGHAQLSGTGKYLEELVKNEIGCKVRSIELNVLQRCASHLSSLTDIEEAYQLGYQGVQRAVEGHTCEMMSLTRVSNAPYEVAYQTVDVMKVANAEKKIPAEWINESGNDVTDKMVEYLRPLILGEPKVEYTFGVPKYLHFDHINQTVK
ncbi:MAG: 6-phosphofructokinase [bacterium]|nr:6-phosphofructokinase [bacterium]